MKIYLSLILMLNFTYSVQASQTLYYKLDPKRYSTSIIVIENNDESDPTDIIVPDPTPIEPVTPPAYEGLTPQTIRAGSTNHDIRIPSMVDRSGAWTLSEFSYAKNIIFTYDQKYEINNIVFGNYCYHPDSAYGRLYYYNYETNKWTGLVTRKRADYSVRSYSFANFKTDKFMVSCTTSRGYVNEFRIYLN